MRKKVFLVISALSTSLAYASCLSDQNHCSVFQISPLVGYYQYDEPNLMKIKGPLVGINGTYFYANSMVALFSQAKLAYNFGSYSSNDTGSISNFPSYYINLSQSVGHRFTFPNLLFAVTPYIGIGYRYLENDGNNKQSSTGHYGYMRQSNYVYMPLGMLLDYRPENWIIQSKVEFDWMFYGSQYSGVDGGVRNTQHSGYGFNANLQVGQPLSANTAWLVGPYVEYWNISDSQVSAGATSLWMEPQNNTIEAGVMLTYLF